MVVVPTSRHVTLTFGTTTVEWVGRLGSLLGFVGLGLLVWWGRRQRFTTRPDAPPAVAAGGPGVGGGTGGAGGSEDLPDGTSPTVRFRSPFRARPPG
jgi:hypothetical protein